LTGRTAPEVLVEVGRAGFPLLAAHHTNVVELIDGWRTLLVGLDDVIHPEALVLHPDAAPPRFELLGGADDATIRLRYRSDRALCPLAEGLVLGAGDWFGTELRVAHRMCVHRGDATCVLEVGEAGDA
ncbi:MAG: heme NO-binding domain-containing protein, partial [Acidimicrobiia bacterium]